MPFITKFNFQRIIGEINASHSIEDELYNKPIYFFNNSERSKLLKIKELLQLRDKDKVTVFKKIDEKEDTQSFVFEGGKPAYHRVIDCSVLNATYVNFPIPEEIKNAGKVSEFREWFKENYKLLSDDSKISEEHFAQRLFFKFNVKIESKIKVPNSGNDFFEDLDLDALEGKIDEILNDSRKFFGKCTDNERKAIKMFAPRAFLYNSRYPINDNDTGLSEAELRAFLHKYDYTFKQPVKDLLIKYYMVKYNPELEFKGRLLEQLGFKACSKCYNKLTLEYHF